MRHYLVELIETYRFQMVVDAESDKEAERIADLRWNGSVDDDGNERTTPISVIRMGELDDDCNIVVHGAVDDDTLHNKRLYGGTLHVGNDALDKEVL